MRNEENTPVDEKSIEPSTMETTKSKNSEEPMMNLKISPKPRPRIES